MSIPDMLILILGGGTNEIGTYTENFKTRIAIKKESQNLTRQCKYINIK